MGIPIESRLSKAALAKRQRSAALRKTRHAFDFVASGQTTPFGLYQENLDNLISHAQENPPQSARLILVSKDLSSPVPVSESASSIIRLYPIFVRHARHSRASGEHASARLHSAGNFVHQSSSTPQNQETRSSERRNAPSRAAVSWQSAHRTLVLNRLAAHASARASHLGPTMRRAHAPLPETHSRPLSISRGSGNQLHQSSTNYMRRNAQMDAGIWNALRRSMLLAASADSLSRAQMWGRFLDRNGRESNTNPGNNRHEGNDSSRSRPPEGPGRPSSTSRNRFRDNHMMSDKAISMLYEVDNGFLWELGCWLGTQHLRTTDIFGILVEVLEKTSEVPGTPVEALCIQDNLFSYSTVRGGVRLLKELSGHLHENYDRTSNFFVHPMNDRRVEIIVSP